MLCIHTCPVDPKSIAALSRCAHLQAKCFQGDQDTLRPLQGAAILLGLYKAAGCPAGMAPADYVPII